MHFFYLSSGGDSKYFVDNIVHFQLTKSVFDLAILSVLKCTIYLLSIHQLEEVIKRSFNLSYNHVLKSQQRKYFTLLVFLSWAVLALCLTKGVLILNEILNTPVYSSMHRTYYACVIWCVVTSLINIVLCLILPKRMMKMKNSRVLKYYNRLNQEVDKEGKLIQHPANLMRLVNLARPVSIAFNTSRGPVKLKMAKI